MSAAKCSAGSIEMSRIGKKAIVVPAGVSVAVEGQKVSVQGPKGSLSWTVAEEIEVRLPEGRKWHDDEIAKRAAVA